MLLGLSIFSWSQTITVIDKTSENPVELVTITGDKPHLYVVTNKKGQADISILQNCDKIEIRSLGYKTIRTSFEEIKQNNYIIYLENSNLNLSEVVISATKWQDLSENVSNKIIHISPQKVEFENPQTAADLLGISGKVYIQKSQQGGGSPMIRGFATNRLLYTVDGVRMNTAIFRGGNIQNVINLDPFTIENSEVLFGPGSVIYGSDAIGGVMSFRTLTPQLSINDKTFISGKSITRFSSANKEKTGHFDVNVGWKKWAIITSISSWDYDNLKQGSHGPDDYIKPYYVSRIDSVDKVVYQEDPLLQIPSAYSQFNLMQKVRYKPNNYWDFQYGFHYSETSPYGRYDRHNRMKNGLPRYAEWNYGPQIWMMNNFEITNTNENTIYDQVSLRLAQQSFEESRINRSLNKNDRTTNKENVEAYSLNIDFQKNLGSKNRLYYGVEYVYNDVMSKGVIKDIITSVTTPGPSRYPLSTWQSYAVYINDKFNINEKFSLQGGIRYNNFDIEADFDTSFYPLPFTHASLNNDAITGSIGGVFRPDKTAIIYANFGTGFRSPNVDDIGKIFDSEPGAVTVPNPDLDAEYAYNIEAGFTKVFYNTLKIDLTGYYTLLDNALVRRDYTLDGQDSIMYDGVLSKVQAIQNAAVANVYGLQAGIEVRLPFNFTFSTDFNYQQGEEELDDGTVSPSRHAAPTFGISKLQYKYNKLQMEVYLVFQDEKSSDEMPVEEKGKDEIYAKDSNGQNYAPGWYTLNYKALYFLTNSISISAGIENITDQRYRPYSSGISGPGRNFIFSIKCSF
ncbi:MAG: TonB-dependent receptor [Marinilabiliales bacterium]